MMKFVGLLAGLLLASGAVSSVASADVTFEGIYRVTKGPSHLGLLILRKEVLGGRIKSIVYVNIKGIESTTTIHESDLKLAPLSFVYSGVSEGRTSEVSGKIQGSTLKFASRAGGKTTPEQTATIPTDVVFGDLVADYIKLYKREFVPGAKMVITQLIDDPGLSVTDVTIGSPQTIMGQSVFPIILKPKSGDPGKTMYVTKDQEPIRITGEFVADLVPALKDAIGSLPVDTKEIERVFGGLPKGVRKAIVVAPTGPAKK